MICGSAAESRATELRASMRELVAPERLVLSVEDPVEYLVSGVGQTEVNALSGQTYPATLQSILRSDPDVAVVSELLDHETTRLAVRGARDRLVLTTLDAPTPASAIRQLIDFGIAPRTIADAAAVVIGHATVRRLCRTAASRTTHPRTSSSSSAVRSTSSVGGCSGEGEAAKRAAEPGIAEASKSSKRFRSLSSSLRSSRAAGRHVRSSRLLSTPACERSASTRSISA